MKITNAILANIIMPVIVGGVMVKLLGDANCVPSWIPLVLPCRVIIFLVTVFLTALILDLIIYCIYPRIKRPSKIKGISLPIPRIPIPVQKSEVRRLFKVIERKLDQRSKVLKKAGLQVKKEVNKDGCFSYQFSCAGQLVYHFSMMPKADFGVNSVGFRDGWIEPRPNTYTAFGTIRATLGVQRPMISLTNLSLLIDTQGIPFAHNDYSYEDLAELIWGKIKNILESRMRK